MNLFGVLRGYKTYVTAALAIAGYVAGYLTGDMDLATSAQGIVTALLAATMRSGLNTAVERLLAKDK